MSVLNTISVGTLSVKIIARPVVLLALLTLISCNASSTSPIDTTPARSIDVSRAAPTAPPRPTTSRAGGPTAALARTHTAVIASPSQATTPPTATQITPPLETPTRKPTATPATAPATSSPATGPLAAAPVLVGAGDFADCGADGAAATARLLDAIEGVVFTTGDNAYDNGSAGQFRRC